MTENPTKEELSVSKPASVERIAIEGIGKRDQVWVHVKHIDGSLATYFNYLDEGYTVVLRQVELLRDALANRSLKAIFHYRDDGGLKRFHAVTVFHER
ncbi:MAG: hypothetical protein H6737_31395 [Alphaproteobacteria bacterium]|nr:hypothetical protein [Alphaproteobacteria bacterium]